MLARKKPVEVEVMQYKGDNKQELYDWSGGTVHLAYESSDTYILVVNTLEGTMVVPKDSYVIKGVEGEFYACDYDIFHKTYELIEKE